MSDFEFEEVWQLLRQLEGRTISTLVRPRRNKIILFMAEGMLRQTEQNGGGWRDAKLVPKSVFGRMWSRLTSNGFTRADQGEYAIAAACLVRVPELRVELLEGKTPRTIVLTDRESASRISSQMLSEGEKMDEFGDRDRIVVDPNICSGKPTIRGTRIMVGNILGMFAGGYTINRVLKAYPELSRLDVVSALNYASWLVDKEKVVARS